MKALISLICHMTFWMSLQVQLISDHTDIINSEIVTKHELEDVNTDAPNFD